MAKSSEIYRTVDKAVKRICNREERLITRKKQSNLWSFNGSRKLEIHRRCSNNGKIVYHGTKLGYQEILARQKSTIINFSRRLGRPVIQL